MLVHTHRNVDDLQPNLQVQVLHWDMGFDNCVLDSGSGCVMQAAVAWSVALTPAMEVLVLTLVSGDMDLTCTENLLIFCALESENSTAKFFISKDFLICFSWRLWKALNPGGMFYKH